MGLYRSGGNLLHAMRGGGVPPHHLFPRPARTCSPSTRRGSRRIATRRRCCSATATRSRRGAIAGTDRHYAVWHDPLPEALLSLRARRRAARPGRRDLHDHAAAGRSSSRIYVEPGKEDRAGYALDALKRSMRWDERVFGREYDLDVFNIVAVSDFNMGAMENKGLNIFNDKYVLASPETATDADYANIEAIIAHEYFHNWTGNRITCRDWFQLCLKEGLTVFRDQEFSSDERSRPVQRIAEVQDAARRASSPRMRARSPIRCGRRTTARSTTSTRRPSTRRAPRSSAC